MAAELVSVPVFVGPVIGPDISGRFRHLPRARTADRAPRLGFTGVLAGVRLSRDANGVQGVAGSNLVSAQRVGPRRAVRGDQEPRLRCRRIGEHDHLLRRQVRAARGTHDGRGYALRNDNRTRLPAGITRSRFLRAWCTRTSRFVSMRCIPVCRPVVSTPSLQLSTSVYACPDTSTHQWNA